MTRATTPSRSYDVVVPTVGRASLCGLLRALTEQRTVRQGAVIVADDRREPEAPLVLPAMIEAEVVTVHSGGRGPAGARNAGVAVATAPWVVFLDDDVIPTTTWARDLERDLDDAAPDVAGVQGRIIVPLPFDRRATDWERNVAGLERAQWATADMAYRRAMLHAVGGFDERFPRAYREDADLGLRVIAAGARLVRGTRTVCHPARRAPWHVSITKQAGNADDALMDRLHGRDWRGRVGAPRGRRRYHVATTLAGAAALSAAVTRRRSVAAAASAVWGAATVDLVRRRAFAGPRTVAEIATITMTSVAIPPAATTAWARGVVRARRLARGPVTTVRTSDGANGRSVDAVLFDRDGTLIIDVPYNDDPARVRPTQGARAAVTRLRHGCVPVAVITNQSGVARGLVRERDVLAVNQRVDELVGPFDAFCVCPHGPDDQCGCRKPAPGLIREAAARLGVDPSRCAVIGDIGADVVAAQAAGALPLLVPTAVTRPEEVVSAPIVAPTIAAAVDLVLGLRGAQT